LQTFRIELLSDAHDRAGFASGSMVLDKYFRTQASQDVRRRITACFVASSEPSSEIVGYYTLTATSIALSDLAASIVKKLPRYPVVPAALLGRLAVSRKHQGQGIDSLLLADALKRTARAELGAFAMVVDAKDERAQQFYEHFGFVVLPGERRRLCLSISAALRHLASK
jgi:ribosomal protein S18 acetylase RimI-like enzyme